MNGTPPSEPWDAVVVGGGPAGSTAAGVLAGAGHRVVVVERERFPRFHIGESLLPAAAATFDRLGVGERIGAEGFTIKRGATFLFEDGSASASIVFSSSLDLSPPPAYQVPRARFDELLLRAAQRRGAVVHERCRAVEVEIAKDGVAVEVEDRDSPGRRERLSASYLIDASGQAGFLAKRLGFRRPEPGLANVALHAHYQGVELRPGVPEGDIQVISRRDLGWLWLIPLSSELTSVGVVMPRSAYRGYGGSKPEILDRLVASTPVAATQLTHARRTGEPRYEADFSYRSNRYAGDRWLLAGDSGSFLDPVFSTGVQLALESGSEAASAIAQALADEGQRRRAFGRYQRRRRQRHRHFARWVSRFYDPAFRDLLCQPTDRLDLLPAAASVLAGATGLSFGVRWRIALLFLVATLHRHVPLARRLHDPRSPAPPERQPAAIVSP